MTNIIKTVIIIIKKVFRNTSEVKNMTKTMINIIKKVFRKTSDVFGLIQKTFRRGIMKFLTTENTLGKQEVSFLIF